VQYLPENGDEKLFPDAPVTLNETLVMVLQFTLKHSLSEIALDDLLKMFTLVLPQNHQLDDSKYLFHKFFQELEHDIKFRYYCERCTRPLTETDPCDHCKEKFENKFRKFMIEVPLESQIKKLFQHREFYDGLSYPFTRKKTSVDSIDDFIEGEIYQKYATFFSEFGNVSISWNTDGIPIFKSSKFSVWPILIKFNSLPPHLREKYVLLIGLHFGEFKPYFNLFLKILADNLNRYYREGFQVLTPSGTLMISRGLLQSDCSDLMANIAAKYFVGFHGYDGCIYCLQKGIMKQKKSKETANSETLKATKKPKKSMVFPFPEV